MVLCSTHQPMKLMMATRNRFVGAVARLSNRQFLLIGAHLAIKGQSHTNRLNFDLERTESNAQACCARTRRPWSAPRILCATDLYRTSMEHLPPWRVLSPCVRDISFRRRHDRFSFFKRTPVRARPEWWPRLLAKPRWLGPENARHAMPASRRPCGRFGSGLHLLDPHGHSAQG